MTANIDMDVGKGRHLLITGGSATIMEITMESSQKKKKLD